MSERATCDELGRCLAPRGSKGVANCVDCGKELRQRDNGSWYTWDAPPDGGRPQDEESTSSGKVDHVKAVAEPEIRFRLKIGQSSSKGGVNDPPRSSRPHERPQGDKPQALISPGDPICKASCPCCGAALDITHGDDEGEVSVIGTAPSPVEPCAAEVVREMLAVAALYVDADIRLGKMKAIAHKHGLEVPK